MKIGENRSIFGETPSKSIVNPSLLQLPTSKSSNFLHLDSIFDYFRELIFRKNSYIRKFEKSGKDVTVVVVRTQLQPRQARAAGAQPEPAPTEEHVHLVVVVVVVVVVLSIKY